MNIDGTKNLFLTGGTGFFGKALLRHWRRKGFSFNKVFILSRNPEFFIKNHSDLISELNVEFIQGDILEASAIKLNEKIDYVLHAATDSTIGPSLGRLEVFNQIVKGTEEVLKFAVNHHCKRFLLASSGAVYGPQPQDMDKIPESYMGSPDPSDPNSAYGLGKRSAEHLCALYSHKYGIECVIARCFAFVGEDLPLDAHFAIGNFIRDALAGKEITVYGDGYPIRSYMHQDDLAAWLMQIMLLGKAGFAYNVGSDEGVTIKELAYAVRDLLHPSGTIKIQGNKISTQQNKYLPDVSYSKTSLGLFLKYGVREAIMKTASKIILNRS